MPRPAGTLAPAAPGPGARGHAWALWLLLGLFVLRVAGQLAVAFLQVDFLPPMEEWYSGTVDYPALLAAQIVLVVLGVAICVAVTTGRGRLARPGRSLGGVLLFVGSVYLAVMLIRYGLRMSLYPLERWTGGSIPVFFHWVLASYVLVLGHYHRRFAARPPRRPRALLAAAIVASIGVAVAVPAWVAYLVAPALLADRFGATGTRYAVRLHRGAGLVTRDGVRLAADVYRPRGADPAPTILVRLAYSKTLQNTLLARIVGRTWAERGYNVVIQGTRGRYESGGDFHPLVHERRDGLDTLAWLARQPWFDGRLGMWGGSYLGYTPWALADRTDPGPDALLVQVASASVYDMLYHGGALALESALFWALGSHGAQNRPVAEQHFDAMIPAFPLHRADDRMGTDVGFFNDWVAHPRRDAYWQAIDGEDRAGRTRAPVLLLAGWFDPFLPAQLADFARLRARVPAEVGNGSHLIVGPWSHARTPPLPDGHEAENYRLASLAPSIAWFDRHLKKRHGTNPLPPVRLFVLGENVWRDEREWPLARTRYTDYYLHAASPAMTLSAERPQGSGTLSFEFDPRNPVPTRGGAMLGTRGGMRAQSKASRDDVLEFTTAPLARALEITGPIRTVLEVSTSAPSTDFTALLLDVHPDGTAYNLSEGILRRAYDPAAAGPVQIDIPMWPTSVLVPAGHRLALRISSSNFPRFDVNPNTGADAAAETEPAVATQSVFWGGGAASRIVLPIIPRQAEGF